MAASYISVPRDLTKVKSKILFNLTKRQLICFSVAALIGVPSFFLLKKFGTVTFATMGMMVIMMPFFFLAMYERNGQPLEVYLGNLIQANFVRPKRRPYKTDNYYAALIRAANVDKEVERIVRQHEADIFKKEKKRNHRSGKSDKGRAGTGKKNRRSSN